MKIRILSIGSEILSGDILNTNLAFTGRQLAQAGYEVDWEACIPDRGPHIESALRQALDGSACVITIGGLGPTRDDLTRTAAAHVLERELVLDEAVADRIGEYVRSQGFRVPAEAIAAQATIPRGARILINRNGTAPGLVFTANGGVLFLLPGPPREYCPMFTEWVLPELRRLVPPHCVTEVIRVCGLPESRVEKMAAEVLDAEQGLGLTICASPEAVVLTLNLPRTAAGRMPVLCRRLRATFGRDALPEDCRSLQEYVGRLLERKGWTLGTAESCTGGALAAALTDVPGASGWFQGAAVTYANEWKRDVLGVRPETIEIHGAVSEPTVQEMVTGLRQRFHVHTGLAVSGIAGPGGGSAEKPVGTVCIGAQTPDRESIRTFRFRGDRNAVRRRAVMSALNMLRLQLHQSLEGTQ